MVHKTIHSPDNWTKEAATIIALRLSENLSTTPRASLVVPGGRTARSVLPHLAQMDLSWDRIDITLSDERWVDAAHPDSNDRLAHEALLENGAGRATFIGLKTDAGHPVQALENVHERLSTIVRPFSVVFVGMGEDGHFASIFPQIEIPRSALSVMAVDRPDHPRLSLTPAALLDSQAIVLVAPGTSKRGTLEKARVVGSALEYPVRHLLHQSRTPVTIVTG